MYNQPIGSQTGKHRIRKDKRIMSLFLSLLIISVVFISGPASAVSVSLQPNGSGDGVYNYRMVVDIHANDHLPLDYLTIELKNNNTHSTDVCYFNFTTLQYDSTVNGDLQPCQMINITSLVNNATFEGGYGYGYAFGYGTYGNDSNLSYQNVSWDGQGYTFTNGYGYNTYNAAVGMNGEIIIEFSIDTTLPGGPEAGHEFIVKAGISGREDAAVKYTYYNEGVETFIAQGSDNVNPDARIYNINGVNNGGLTNNRTLRINITAADDFLANWNLSVYNLTGSIVNSTINTSSVIQQIAILTVPADGSYRVNLTVTDNTSNVNSTAFNITVDTTAPVIAYHDNETAEANSSSGIAVDYDSPETYDAVDGNGTATCLPASGSNFGMGVNTITCTAQDSAGNNATPTTFTITVQDTTAPVIAAHGDITEEATGPDGAEVDYTSPATSDAVDGNGTATCLPESGDEFELGETTVTCNAQDSAGNNATPTTFTITVQDTTELEIEFHEDITEEATGPDGAEVDYDYPETYDDVDGEGVADCLPASGSTFSLGNTTVTCTAEDEAGNDAEPTTFTITVEDTTAPYNVTINLNPTTVQLNGIINVSCTALDSVDEDVDVLYNEANTSQAGVGRINCTATDDSGNTNTTSATYIVNGTGVILLDGDVTVNENQTEVIVTANSPDSGITIPQNVTNATLDLSALTQESNGTITATLNGSINVSANTTVGVVLVQFPSNLTITSGANWTGIIDLPKVASSSSVNVIPDSGKTATVSEVIEIGFANISITFDKAVRILFPGQAGKEVGFYNNGVFTRITTTCSNDTQADGDNLTAGGECKMVVDNDLVVWTKHFTSYVTYSQADTPTVGTRRSSGASNYTSSVGALPVFWTLTRHVESGSFESGYTTTLAARQRLSFLVGNETHHAGIIDLNSGRVIINISSTPQQIELAPGDDAKLDVNGDNYYDVYIELNSIDSNKSIASLTVRSIYEAIPSTQATPSNDTSGGELTPPVTNTPQICVQGEKRCLSNELQACVNGNWQNIENCPNGCLENTYECIEAPVLDKKTDNFWPGMIILLLLLVALALLLFKRKKKEKPQPNPEKTVGGTHKAKLHSKVSDLEQRITKLEKKGENMKNIKLVVEEIKQDISVGLHYIAEGRIEALNREMAFVEAI